MTEHHIRGLVAATFTPFDAQGEFDPDKVPEIVSHLEGNGIAALFVNGTTGEGQSLTVEERKQAAEAFIAAAKQSPLKIIIHVGHESIRSSEEMAAHAAQAGADYIAATPPCFFKIDSTQRLIAQLSRISAAAPSTPLYYYHIPRLTGVGLDMLELLRAAERELPSLVGIKYTALELNSFIECTRFAGGKYNMLFGCDEQLLAGLAMGAHGAVGSTYNFLAPLYHRVMSAYEAGDMATAQQHQAKAAELIRILTGSCGFAGLKTGMMLAGVDCGGLRLPNAALSPGIVEEVRNRLEAAGFFEWVGSAVEV